MENWAACPAFRSLKVIDSEMDRSHTCDFLLMIHAPLVSVSEIDDDFSRKTQNSSTLCITPPPLSVLRFEFCEGAWASESRWCKKFDDTIVSIALADKTIRRTEILYHYSFIFLRRNKILHCSSARSVLWCHVCQRIKFPNWWPGPYTGVLKTLRISLRNINLTTKRIH